MAGGWNHLEAPILPCLVPVLGRPGDQNWQMDSLEVASSCDCSKWLGLEPRIGSFRTIGFLTQQLKALSMTSPANKVIATSSFMTQPWKLYSLTSTMFHWSSSPKPIQVQGAENQILLLYKGSGEVTLEERIWEWEMLVSEISLVNIICYVAKEKISTQLENVSVL